MRKSGRRRGAQRAASHVGALDDEARGPGAADHDLGPGQLVASDSKGAALPPSAAASSSAFSKLRPPSTVARAPPAHEVARRQLAHLARAHQQHLPVAQLAEDLARQLHGHGRDRDGVAADAGLRARAFGRGQGAVAQRVQDRAQGAPAASARS